MKPDEKEVAALEAELRELLPKLAAARRRVMMRRIGKKLFS